MERRRCTADSAPCDRGDPAFRTRALNGYASLPAQYREVLDTSPDEIARRLRQVAGSLQS
jgi:hypothetical protein